LEEREAVPSAFFLQFASACISERSFLASLRVHAISMACLPNTRPPPSPKHGVCGMPWTNREKSSCSPMAAFDLLHAGHVRYLEQARSLWGMRWSLD
jgi:hypothetical protein